VKLVAMRTKNVTPQQIEELRRSLTTAVVELDGDHGGNLSLSVLDAGGTPTPIGRAERLELLGRLRAGEHIELQAEILGFIQRETPNRNYVRFKPGILPSFSTSFRGVPFLRDHASRDYLARGGKVVSTTFQHREDGSKAIAFKLHLVKAWAVEGFLDGTIDRFSIGWARTGPVVCSLDDKPLWGPGCCMHWPGDVVDGKVCEVLYTGAEGTESSAVNGPAVVGTGIESVRGLKAEFDGTAVLNAILGTQAQEPIMDLTKILAALNLPADATPEQIAAAIAERDSKLAAAASDAELARAQLGEAKTKLAEIETRATTAEGLSKQQKIDGAIASLKSSRKLQIVHGGQSKVEMHLRKLAESDLELFTARCAEIGEGPDVRPTGDKPDALGKEEGGDGGRGAEDVAKRWLKKAGLSAAEIEKYGKKHLDALAGR
jgi:hypothetical protein